MHSIAQMRQYVSEALFSSHGQEDAVMQMIPSAPFRVSAKENRTIDMCRYNGGFSYHKAANL